MTSTPTVEGVQDTIAEYERLAIETGQWDGTETPEFSADGAAWAPFWLATEGQPHPALARVTVHRKGVAYPTTVVVVWAESLPADESWRALWMAKPTALFGAFATRAALRRAFREALGDRREPDDAPSGPPAAPVEPSPARDWLVEIGEASDTEQLAAIHADAKRARAITVPISTAFQVRRTVLVNAETQSPTNPPAAESAAMRAHPVPTPPKVRPEDTLQRPKGKRS